MDKFLADALDMPALEARNDPGVPAALRQANKRVHATYFLPYLSHAIMEPMNATAHVQADRCETWSPSQSPTGVQQVAARITGLKPEQIHVHTPYLGGGYGGRGATEGVHEAVSLSKVTGKPIKVIWTREEDIKYEAYRPGYGHRIDASLDKTGKMTAWSSPGSRLDRPRSWPGTSSGFGCGELAQGSAVRYPQY